MLQPCVQTNNQALISVPPLKLHYPDKDGGDKWLDGSEEDNGNSELALEGGSGGKSTIPLTVGALTGNLKESDLDKLALDAFDKETSTNDDGFSNVNSLNKSLIASPTKSGFRKISNT